MNVPLLTAGALGTFLLYQMNRGPTASEASEAIACTEKYCPLNHTIHVDRAVNTALRDDTKGGPTLSGAYHHVKSQYLKEAREAPGVKLVAHTVV